MGAPGWDDAPEVQVARGGVKTVTLLWPYYENPKFLRYQMDHLASFDPWLKEHLKLIVVDDGSPKCPAERVLEVMQAPAPTKLYRILVDIRWNWLAARNLGMKHAEGWCLLTDIDHVVPEKTLDSLVRGEHDPGMIYRFRRKERDGEDLHPHPNSFFLTRDMFWQVGGYDEALSGFYGSDGDWRRRCVATAPIATLREHLVRHEFVMDSSTVKYLRKQPEDAGKKAIIRERGPGWRPKILSFPWNEITLWHSQ